MSHYIICFIYIYTDDITDKNCCTLSIESMSLSAWESACIHLVEPSQTACTTQGSPRVSFPEVIVLLMSSLIRLQVGLEGTEISCPLSCVSLPFSAPSHTRKLRKINTTFFSNGFHNLPSTAPSIPSHLWLWYVLRGIRHNNVAENFTNISIPILLILLDPHTTHFLPVR